MRFHNKTSLKVQFCEESKGDVANQETVTIPDKIASPFLGSQTHFAMDILPKKFYHETSLVVRLCDEPKGEEAISSRISGLEPSFPRSLVPSFQCSIVDSFLRFINIYSGNK